MRRIKRILRKLSRKANRRNFRRTATRLHKKNLYATIRRGGTRL